jgi:prepilin-type processing-associated H-X9-DG protein
MRAQKTQRRIKNKKEKIKMTEQSSKMNETEKVEQGQKPRISKLAIASLLFGILGFFIIVLRITAYRPWWSEFVGRNIIGFSGIVGLILGTVALARISRLMAAITSLAVLCPFLIFYFSMLIGSRQLLTCSFLASLACLVGLLIGGAVLQWMSKLKEKFKGAAFAILGIVLTAFLSGLWWAETCGPVSGAWTMMCGSNLSQLRKAMLIYVSEHQGQYPEPNQWCDLLLKHTDVNVKCFFCPGVKLRWHRQVFPWPVPKKAKCYYAINPNCEPNSPGDVVLLFETKGGWNQCGGPEILTTGNHYGRCNILFNDGHVEIVKPKGLMELKWKDK